jgi:hypothetical protein
VNEEEYKICEEAATAPLKIMICRDTLSSLYRHIQTAGFSIGSFASNSAGSRGTWIVWVSLSLLSYPSGELRYSLDEKIPVWKEPTAPPVDPYGSQPRTRLFQPWDALDAM